MKLQLSVRRFFCDTAVYRRKVFVERFHPSIAAYARSTARFERYLQTLALQVGGEGACLLTHLLNEKKAQEMSLDSQQGKEVRSITKSELCYKQVKELQAKGWSIKKWVDT